MTQHNGSPKKPATAAARNMAELGDDAVRLAELQTQLFQTEVRNWIGGATMPVVLLAFATIVAMGSVPVLLVSVAYWLANFADLSLAVSLLLTGAGAMAVAGIIAAVGLRQLRSNTLTLELSRAELHRNIRWLKQVLYRRPAPSQHGQTPQHGPYPPSSQE